MPYKSSFPPKKPKIAPTIMPIKYDNPQTIIAKVIEILNDKNIPSMIYYKIPLHLQKVFKNLNYKIGDFPNTESIANKIISLPMHPYLKRSDQDFIINNMNSLYSK